MKKVGRPPTSKASDAKPKAKADLPGKMLEITTKVIGIVILKRNIPIIARCGISGAKTRSGMENSKDKIAVLIKPNRSANTPPKDFPRKTAETKAIAKFIFSFQGKTIVKPTKALTAIEIKIKNKTNSKVLSSIFLFIFLE